MRLWRFLILVPLGVAALVATAWVAARPPTPDAFYAAVMPPNSMPGLLIRAERFERGVPAGARGWRILYVTTRENGGLTLASGLIVQPVDRASQPRPVIAWAHGTTGIVPGCAPSLSAKPFANLPAFESALAEGWTIVATDYAGLGTAGPHGYLVGRDAAASVLDALRAARSMPDLSLGPLNVVWGHSQGGHAALWTGIIANDYAPDVRLAGVAALAPATDLPALMATAETGGFGSIVAAFVVHALGRRFDDIDVDATILPRARLIARDIAGRCVGGYETLFSVAQTLLLPPGGLIAQGRPRDALFARLHANTPSGAIPMPLFIAQGEADDLVLPDIQRRFVADRCAAQQSIDFKLYPGLDHISLVAPGSVLSGDILSWTRARFAGEVVTPGCPAIRS